MGRPEAKKLDIDLGLVYNLGHFPDFRLNTPEADNVIHELMKYLEQRIDKKKILLNDLNMRQDQFRLNILNMEKENITIRTENIALKGILKQERQKISALENKILIHESSIDDLNRRLRDREDNLRELQKRVC